MRRLSSDSDLLLTAAALPLSLILSVPHGDWTADIRWGLLLDLLAWMPLTVRTRRPLPVAALVVALDAVHVGLDHHQHPATNVVTVATMLALYTLSVRYSARTAWSTAAGVGLLFLLVASLTAPWQSSDLLYLNWPLVATALGRLGMERRERIAVAEERAEAAERSKDDEAQRQVTAERMRIARDLHDVLAHHIVAVNAQAGVAQYLLTSDPDAAGKALAGIVANTRSALDELRVTLGLLRFEGDSDDRAPAPSASLLAELVEEFRRTGMSVTFVTNGTPGLLNAAADLAVYRIAQEALTNASKYAPGSAVRVELRWDEHAVTVTVANDVAPGSAHLSEPADRGTGHGLLGMRERAASANGSISTLPTTDGGFLVRAQLPVVAASAPTLSAS
ncbi:hypothetical protein acdb102_23870 [Acidothermaceae bacterium B102]|nr:hypothetical protein acdb102_23870 [Acidothermaceae bacterium B102]